MTIYKIWKKIQKKARNPMNHKEISRRHFLKLSILSSGAAWSIFNVPSAVMAQSNNASGAQPNGGDDEQLKAAYQRFKNLPPEKQALIKERYEKFKNLSAEDKQKIRRNFIRWRRLNPQQKQNLKARWQRFQAMPADKKHMIKERWRKFRALPADKKQNLRQRFRNRR